MDIWARFKAKRTAERKKNNSQISQAMQAVPSRTAGLLFDINNDNNEKLFVDRNANIKAMQLISELLGSFGLPSKPSLEYHGMLKNATAEDGTILDGVIKIGAIIRTLMGHRANIDIPVIVRERSLLEPAVFFYDGAPYVMCAPAFEQLVKRGTLERTMQPRSMFSTAIEIENAPKAPITNLEHMYSPGVRNPFTMKRYSDKESKHKGEPRKRTNIDTPTEFPELWEELPEHMLDPAERTREGLLSNGTNVTLKEDCEVRERGGGSLIVPSGESGVVCRDEDGTGCMVYVCFPAMGIEATVPKKMLNSKKSKRAKVTAEQVKHEVREMLREGYQSSDIEDAVKRRFPQHAEEVLKDL
jgi:hypothetical protein